MTSGFFMTYTSVSEYYKKIFGRKIYKITLDAGCTCPNRDGTKAVGGCIFCSAAGSGAAGYPGLAGGLIPSLPGAHSAVPGELFSKKDLTKPDRWSKIAPTFIEQGCEGKSKPADAVQRAPVGGKGYG